MLAAQKDGARFIEGISGTEADLLAMMISLLQFFHSPSSPLLLRFNSFYLYDQ